MCIRDRDVSNWLISENNDVVAIDNARTGCTSFESYRNRLPEKIVPFSVANKDIPVPCFFDTGVNKTIKDKFTNDSEDDAFLKLVKDITSKGFVRSNYKEKLVDLSNVRINLKSKK